MKKISVIISIFFLTVTGFSQEQNDKNVKEIVRDVKNEKRDRIVVNLNFDNWFHKMPAATGFETKWFSRGLDIYLMYDLVIKKSQFSLGAGFGYSTSNIFHNALILDDSTGTTVNVIPSDEFDAIYKKNKISMSYLDIPIELRFRSKPSKKNNSFKLSVGFKAGVKVDAHTKSKVEYSGEKEIFKAKRFPDIRPFRYGPTFRVGYGNISLTAYYGLSEVFKADRGPSEIVPFSIGISINGL